MSLISVEDYKKAALKKLPRKVSTFYAGGAGDEFTLRLNIQSYQRLRIIPRVLVDVSKRNMSTNVLGLDFSMPIAIAPTAFHKMAHPLGEAATAKAAGNAGIAFTLSTVANTSIEEVANYAPETNKWFQLFIYKDRTVSESIVRRAEAAGFKAIVFTLDGHVLGIRRQDARNRFALPPHLTFANFDEKMRPGSDTSGYVTTNYETNLTCDDIKWLKSITKLPIIVKGILNPLDAILAVENGADGVIVSNHGGRQLDTAPAPIEVLPRIVEAVGDRTVVMMDGGVRQGTDIFKALALGAKLVLIGRPAIWGLAVNGAKGVEDVLGILRKELDIVMALTGCPTLKDIKKDMVVHESTFSKL